MEGTAPKRISRRKLFAWLGWGSLMTFLVGLSTAMARFFYPKVLYEPDPRFQAGFPEDFPTGRMIFFPDQKVYVVREPHGFHAVSAVCTHLGCTVEWDRQQKVFWCPCHGSRFHRDGHNYAGPAPRPLDSFALSLDDLGRLVVDKGITIPRSKGRMGEFETYFKV